MKKCWHPLYNYVLKVKNKYIELSGNTTCYNFNEMLDYLYTNCNKDADTFSLLEVFKPLIVNSYNEFVLFKYENYIELSEMGITEEDLWKRYDGLYLECRSVVFDIKNEELVLGPQPKFFNVGQIEGWFESEVKDLINKCDFVEFSNKLDGNNQNYRYYNGEYIGGGAMAIDPKMSPRLVEGYEMLTDNYKQMLRDYPDYTFMFEFISLNFPIVVKYTSEQQGLYLFGMRDVKTGAQKTYREVIDIANKYGVKTTELYDETYDSIKSTLDDYSCDSKEGWVIGIWKNGEVFKAKLKVTDYVLMHKAISKITSPNAIINAIEAGRYDDYIAMAPQSAKEEVREIANLVFEYINKMNEAVNGYYSSLTNFLNENNPDNIKKEGAIWIRNNVPKCYQKYVNNLLFYGNSNNFLKSQNGRYTKLTEIKNYLEKLS